MTVIGITTAEITITETTVIEIPATGHSILGITEIQFHATGVLDKMTEVTLVTGHPLLVSGERQFPKSFRGIRVIGVVQPRVTASHELKIRIETELRE